MKTKLLQSLLAIACLLCSIEVYAHDFEVDGIFYNIIDSYSVTVTFKGDFDTQIDEYAGEVVIPDIVNYNGKTYYVAGISDGAFINCSNVTSVIFPNTSIAIGEYAFSGCTGITSLTIPQNLYYLSENSFYGCSGLRSIIVEDGNISYDSRYNCNAIINTGSSTLVLGCSNTIIPEDVQSIGQYAFSNCIGLTEITIPESITYIGAAAFTGCSGLKYITIPGAIFEIAPETFLDCSGLTEIIFTEGLFYIGSASFKGCSNLEHLTIPSSVYYICDEAFSGCLTLKSITVDILDPFISIDERSFDGVNKSTPLIVPPGRSCAYKSNPIWSKFTNIVEKTPFEVDGLYFDIINQEKHTLELINGNSKYSGDIVIPQTVTYNDSTFIVVGIGKSAFTDCDNLSSITSGAIEPFKAYSGTFEGVDKNIPVYVPKGSVNAYRTADYWSEFTNIIEISQFDVSGIKYRIIDNVNMSVAVESNTNKYEGDILIPQTVIYNGTTYNVTTISEYAFADCIGMTSVTIPESVTSIEDYAFEGCTALYEVRVNSTTPPAVRENTFVGIDKTIAVYVVDINSYNLYINAEHWNDFTNIKVALYNYSKFELDGIYYNVTDIDCGTLAVTYKGNWSGEFNNYVGDIIIPATVSFGGYEFQVTSIGDDAFAYNLITSVNIPNSVTSIGYQAFASCWNLITVNIPESVTTIPFGMFNGCSTLKSLVIPEGVTSIEDNAFYGCVGLTSLVIPQNVNYIANNAFQGCINLISIEVDKDNTVYDSRENCNAIIQTESNTLICGLKSTIIPGSVEEIGDYAFSGTELSSIIIPEGVKYIRQGAFSECKLKSVSIPSSVIQIDDAAFNVGYFDNSSFEFIIPLKEIIVNNQTPPAISSFAFSFYDATETPLYVPMESVESYKSADGWSVFTNVLPIADTEIGAKFEVENIYYKVTANNEVTVTFEGNSYDAVQDEYSGEVYIPHTVTYNGTIYTVTSIDNYAFRGCNDITLLRLESTKPPLANENTFDGVDRTLPIYVLEGCAKTYITANYWEEFTNIVESASLPDYCKFEADGIYYTVTAQKESVAVSLAGLYYSEENYLEYYKGDIVIPSTVSYRGYTYDVTSIEGDAFRASSQLTSIVIPESVTSIGWNAFNGCTGLRSVSLPNSITEIGPNVFEGCTALTEITIPENVTSIGYMAFSNTNLTSIFIPQGVSYIEWAFMGCSALTSIIVDENNPYYNSRDNCNAIIETASNTLIVGCKNTIIPNSVTSIGRQAFWECTDLAEISIPNSVTQIEYGAFTSCTGLTSVKIPDNIVSIGDLAFQNCSNLRDVAIPSTITTIGWCAFRGCDNLSTFIIDDDSSEMPNAPMRTLNNNKSPYRTVAEEGISLGSQLLSGCINLNKVVLPNRVTQMCDSVFYNCQSLDHITIPANITSIGADVFNGCDALQYIESNAITPPVIDVSTFNGIDRTIPLHIPANTQESYSTAEYWNEFTNMYEPIKLEIVNSWYSTLTLYENYGSTQKLLFEPIDITKYELQSVMYNGVDVSAEVIDGIYNTPALISDAQIEVKYAQISQEKETAHLIKNAEPDDEIKLTIINSESNTVTVFEEIGSEQSFKIKSADDSIYIMNTIVFNGNEITADINGIYTTPLLLSDAYIKPDFNIATTVRHPQQSNVDIYGMNGNIVIVGCHTGESIAIYAIDGILLRTIFATSDSMRIAMPTDAVYVVKVADAAVKVAL